MEFAGLRAHTNSPSGGVDTLIGHSWKVARLAAEFGKWIGSSEVCSLLGLLHDVGKAMPGFQDYLDRLDRGEKLDHGPPHAIWGAAVWYSLAGERWWREVCLPIAGHHAGLSSKSDLGVVVHRFVEENDCDIQRLLDAIRKNDFLRGILPPHGLSGTRLEMRIRFLLSCLCDADFLATEDHFSPGKANFRVKWPTFAELWPRFDEKQRALLARAKATWNDVQRVRAEVYQDCLTAAKLPPGMFRLTVPTGGGKTLSSLAFALRHADMHFGLRRIVLAVPYTSITEQSARVYRDFLGSDAVLEHHSNLPFEEDKEGQNASQVGVRLAAENWDAPVIVTTTVQLFESLFARRTSKVRKLHNLAGSVILLDEVQTLPLELLRSTLDGLRSLVLDAGASVVLCTATQPTFDDSPYLDELRELAVREIVTNPAAHFSALRRVEYERWTTPISWSEFARHIAGQKQALVILNTRRDALSLLDALDGTEGLVHLSTLLCGAHRRKVLAEIERRLPVGEPVVAVCTQVVEAGVDIDFPAVYRAVGPLDRIVQAAGRCNRSGRSELGRVVIFEPSEGHLPKGSYRIGADQGAVMLDRLGPGRLHDPDIYREYFQRLFSLVDLDSENIQDARLVFDYWAVAEKYHFMEDTVPVLVSYEGAEKGLLREWKQSPTREVWRQIQPFLVNLSHYEVRKLEGTGQLVEEGKGLLRWCGKYDEKLRGLRIELADLIV